MEAQQVISLSGLLKFFEEDQNSIQKGEFKYNSNFVLEVKINGFEISATVRASMKDKSYKVGLSVDGTGSIVTATCDCPRGQWICSHMAAASIYVNKKGFSKTDLPNSWIARPKTSEKQTGMRTMQQLFPSPKPLFKAVQRSVTQEDRNFFYRKLSDFNVDCPFRWILAPEPRKVEDPLAPALIEDLLPIFTSDRSQFIQKIRVLKEQQRWVAENTKGQRKNYM